MRATAGAEPKHAGGSASPGARRSGRRALRVGSPAGAQKDQGEWERQDVAPTAHEMSPTRRRADRRALPVGERVTAREARGGLGRFRALEEGSRAQDAGTRRVCVATHAEVRLAWTAVARIKGPDSQATRLGSHRSCGSSATISTVVRSLSTKVP